MVDHYYGNKDCLATRFHKEVLARPDIDAMLIGTGDRWHAVLSVLAARAGKDAYCEKPCCLTIAEGRALVETYSPLRHGLAVRHSTPLQLLLPLRGRRGPQGNDR